jgi:hypothetical protein
MSPDTLDGGADTAVIDRFDAVVPHFGLPRWVRNRIRVVRREARQLLERLKLSR